jgi:hypothetical protein
MKEFQDIKAQQEEMKAQLKLLTYLIPNENPCKRSFTVNISDLEKGEIKSTFFVAKIPFRWEIKKSGIYFCQETNTPRAYSARTTIGYHFDNTINVDKEQAKQGWGTTVDWSRFGSSFSFDLTVTMK